MIIGGETVTSRENEHSTSVEIIGPNGLCRMSGVPGVHFTNLHFGPKSFRTNFYNIIITGKKLRKEFFHLWTKFSEQKIVG
jgi:hypothetical protein